MSLLRPDPGSFRDPGGRIFISEDRVFRAVMPTNADAYQAAKKAGLYESLTQKGLLLSSREVPLETLGDYAKGAVQALEHPRLPFISYPYEWSFALHQAAALLHLDLHLEALNSGFTLSDATAYNVQFQGTHPVFIDHLSLQPYRNGELWTGHRQFCMQFLNPLIMWSVLGVAPNAWFRGSLDGIAPEDVLPLLPLRKKLSWTVLTHVVAQAMLQKRSVGRSPVSEHLRERKLPKSSLVGMLTGLRNYIARLQPPGGKTVWEDYAGANSYSSAEVETKKSFVGEMTASVKPKLLFDIGCNTGDYSKAALDAGAVSVIGFDYDHAVLDRAYARFNETQQNFIPLWLDAANPSPMLGWAQKERQGFGERAKADAIIALAFIHHIVIGRNVPLGMAVEWLINLAPAGIIEFPPKEDPMVKRLLALRKDIFPDYTKDAFLSEVSKHARMARTQELSENGRLLVWFERNKRSAGSAEEIIP